MNGPYGTLCIIQKHLLKEFGVEATIGICKYNGKPMYKVNAKVKNGESEITMWKIRVELGKMGIYGKVQMKDYGNRVSCRFFEMPRH